MLYKGELVINGRIVSSRQYNEVATHPHQIAKDIARRVAHNYRYFVVNVINEKGSVWTYDFDMMAVPHCVRGTQTLPLDVTRQIMAGNRPIMR